DVDERVFRREDHVGRSKERIGTRREDLDVELLVPFDGEAHGRAGGTTDPVSLHQLDRVGPVERVEIVEQAVVYAVIRNIHCFSGRRYTGKLPRSLRPSA